MRSHMISIASNTKRPDSGAQTRQRLRIGARRAVVRGAAVVRGGAGAGPRRRGARAAVPPARAAAAQRVQAAHAPLRLRRGRLVLAAPPRALPAGRARAPLRRARRAHRLSAGRGLPRQGRSRFILGDRVHRRLSSLGTPDAPPGPPRAGSGF